MQKRKLNFFFFYGRINTNDIDSHDFSSESKTERQCIYCYISSQPMVWPHKNTAYTRLGINLGWVVRLCCCWFSPSHPHFPWRKNSHWCNKVNKTNKQTNKMNRKTAKSGVVTLRLVMVWSRVSTVCPSSFCKHTPQKYSINS